MSKNQLQFTDDGLIPPSEAEHMIKIYHTVKGKQFMARDLASKFNISYPIISRILRAGIEYGVFKIKIKTTGNSPAVYVCNNVNVEKIAHEKTRKSTNVYKPSPWKNTECELANILGMKPIEHECNPRVIPEKKVLRATRGREKVYVSGGWMEGL